MAPWRRSSLRSVLRSTRRPDSFVHTFSDARTVLTLNRRDFIRLHDSGVERAGIVVCTFDLDFAGQAKRIHAEVGSRVNLTGRLVRVHRPSG